MGNDELKREGSLKLSDFLKNRRLELGMSMEQMSSACDMPVMMYKLFEEGYQKLEDLGKNPLINALANGMRVMPDKIRALCGKSFY